MKKVSPKIIEEKNKLGKLFVDLQKLLNEMSLCFFKNFKNVICYIDVTNLQLHRETLLFVYKTSLQNLVTQENTMQLLKSYKYIKRKFNFMVTRKKYHIIINHLRDLQCFSMQSHTQYIVTNNFLWLHEKILCNFFIMLYMSAAQKYLCDENLCDDQIVSKCFIIRIGVTPTYHNFIESIKDTAKQIIVYQLTQIDFGIYCLFKQAKRIGFSIRNKYNLAVYKESSKISIDKIIGDSDIYYILDKELYKSMSEKQIDEKILDNSVFLNEDNNQSKANVTVYIIDKQKKNRCEYNYKNYLLAFTDIYLNQQINRMAIYELWPGKENQMKIQVKSNPNEYTNIIVLRGFEGNPIEPDIAWKYRELIGNIIKTKFIVDEYKHIGTKFDEIHILIGEPDDINDKTLIKKILQYFENFANLYAIEFKQNSLPSPPMYLKSMQEAMVSLQDK